MKYHKLSYYKNQLNRGPERSVKAKKNIIALLFRKGISVVISYLMVPLLIDYLNPTRYGIWLTVSVFITWFFLFDIGLGNGLRNKFTEAIANGKDKLARIYVSTTYAIVSIIAVFVFVSYWILFPIIDWGQLFNAPEELDSELASLVTIMVSYFTFQFIVKLISTILIADQRPAIAGYFNTISSILTLLLLVIAIKVFDSSLIIIGYIFSVSNILVPLIASFYFYNSKYQKYRPSIRWVKFSYSRDLFSLGLMFFAIQIASVIIYSSSNMLISHLFSPAEVTPYNVSFKYFSIITMVFAIVMTPFWSAITDAYVREDLIWIKTVIIKLLKLVAVFSIASLILVICSGFVYRIWVGEEITIPFSLTIVMGIYSIVFIWNSVFASFLNGVGKIRLQLYIALLQAIFIIPLALFFTKAFNLGITGVALSILIVNILSSIFGPFQFYLIINNKAKGIWAK
ncbi:MAG TPA: polysaccharide biosynthesis protein [Bacteroidales bacterium]|nr:polysaccharide biosynthesis protein [Bacteroidales bacterium]